MATKEKEEKKPSAKAPVKTEAPKGPKSNEEIVLGLKKDAKKGEEPTVVVGGEKFLIKEVRGLELVLTRKDYR